MGRKLVRDFVPGMQLAVKGLINGSIRTADDKKERLLLGAEKIVEEANELLAAVKAELEANRDLPTRISNDIHRELGDVVAAVDYTAAACGVSVADAVRAKAISHGEFTKHFVWEWPGDEQPRTIGKDRRKHDPCNLDCPLNQVDILDSRGECTCPVAGRPGDEQPRTIGKDERKHDPRNSACPWNSRVSGSAQDDKQCTCPVAE